MYTPTIVFSRVFLLSEYVMLSPVPNLHLLSYLPTLHSVCAYSAIPPPPQAADARRALPCWDEPAHKATFDVTLIVPKDRVALSNMVQWSLV